MTQPVIAGERAITAPITMRMASGRAKQTAVIAVIVVIQHGTVQIAITAITAITMGRPAHSNAIQAVIGAVIGAITPITTMRDPRRRPGMGRRRSG